MAQITWRNIDAPNLSGAIAGIDVASRTLDRAIQSFTGIADSNAAQIQKNIQSLDDQGQAAILQQMAAFSTPEQLTEAIQAGTFDDVMAGMTGSAQAEAQGHIAKRSDTLLDQSIRRRDQELREADQKLRRDQFSLIDLPTFTLRKQAVERDIKNTEGANAILSAWKPIKLAAEMEEARKRVANQFLETHPEWYENGNLVRERVNDQAAIERFAREYEALKLNDSLRVQQYRTSLANTVDVGSPQFEQISKFLDEMHRIQTEGTARDQRQDAQFINNWKLVNKAENNPFIEYDEMVASGKTLVQSLEEAGIYDEIMKNPDKYPSSLITGMTNYSIKSHVRVNGVDVPITPTMFKIALAKGADAWAIKPGDTFEDALVSLAKQAIGNNPNMPTLIEQRDAFRAAVNAERTRRSGDPHIVLSREADYWRQAAEVNRERAAKAANAGNGSSSGDSSTLDAVVRNMLTDSSTPSNVSKGSVNSYLKQNGGQIETLSKSAIPKMTESELTTYQTLLLRGAAQPGAVTGRARRKELIEFLNRINSR